MNLFNKLDLNECLRTPFEKRQQYDYKN